MTKRNHSIDIFRYVCAILVVAVHTHPFADVNEKLGYVFTEVLPRIAVPFFFVVAGYFYIGKLKTKKKVFWPYIKRILGIYAVWSCVYFLVDFVYWGHQNIKEFVSNCLYGFVLYGSYYHFWFFPALIFAVCVTTIFYKLRLQKLLLPLSLLLYTIGCLGCSYYSIGMKIPGLSALFASPHFTLIRRVVLMGLPFFAAGSLVAKMEKFAKKHTLSKCSALLALLGAILCFLFEIFIVTRCGLQENIIVTFGLYLLTVTVMLVLLNFPMTKAQNVSTKCHFLADFTYYVHPMVTFLLSIVAKLIGITITQTPMFVLTVALIWLIGMGYMFVKKKRVK